MSSSARAGRYRGRSLGVPFVGAIMSQIPELKIGKLDAARRQLETAIALWFKGGDPVSIHTLAYAAYEIIHTVSKKRNPNRRDLLFDTLLVRDEYRKEFAELDQTSRKFFQTRR